MTSNSPACALGDLLDRVIDHRGRTPKKLGGDFVTSGVPVISARSIKNSRLDLGNDVRFVTREMWERWMPVKLKEGDVLLTSEAPLGEVAYLRDNIEYCLGQRLFALRPDPTKLSARFLFYALRSPALRHRLLARASGTTAQGIRQAELVKLEMDTPPVSEQCRIAGVLGSLDDKIENNRRIAETLEQIAATLYRARFVDFVDHDDLVDSELGPIPRGWKVAPVGEVVQIVGGSTPSTKNPRYWDGGTHAFATPKDLSGLASPVLQATARQITDAGVQQISSKRLPKRTVLLSSRAPIGYTVISNVDVAVNQGFIAIPPSDAMPSEYVLFWLRQNLDRIKANAGGTTFAEISKRAFRPLPMLVPPPFALTEFERVVRPLIDLLAQREGEARLLSSIRSALLPRLISGKVRVPSKHASALGVA